MTKSYYYSIDDYYLSPNFLKIEEAYEDAKNNKIFKGMKISPLLYCKRTNNYFFYANNNIIQLYEDDED